MPDPIELQIPPEYQGLIRKPQIALGQGPLYQGAGFQFDQPQFNLPAEPVAPLPPTSIEQRQGAMSTTDKFFAALRGLAAGLQNQPDPTQALHERQFERDQQRYLAEKQDYEAARRQFQLLKSHAELQKEHLDTQKKMAEDEQKFRERLQTSTQKFEESQQASRLASEEYRTGIAQWGEMLRSPHPATVEAGLRAIESNPAARKVFGDLPRAEILDQAKAFQQAGINLQTATTRFHNAQASIDELKHNIATGKVKATREQQLAAGIHLDSLLDVASEKELTAMESINPAMASAVRLARLSQNPLQTLVTMKLVDAFQKAKPGEKVDAAAVIDELMNQLKETDESFQRGWVTLQSAWAKALQDARGDPDLTERTNSFFRLSAAHYMKKLKMEGDVSKMGATVKEQMGLGLGKIIDEEAKKAEEAKRGRGGPLLPGLSKP